MWLGDSKGEKFCRVGIADGFRAYGRNLDLRHAEVEGPEVYVTFTLTSPGCPIGPQVADQIREYVSDLEGIEKVHPKMVFTPPWTPELMSEDAKFALGY